MSHTHTQPRLGEKISVLGKFCTLCSLVGYIYFAVWYQVDRKTVFRSPRVDYWKIFLIYFFNRDSITTVPAILNNKVVNTLQ